MSNIYNRKVQNENTKRILNQHLLSKRIQQLEQQNEHLMAENIKMKNDKLLCSHLMEVTGETDEIIHLRKNGTRNKSIACMKLPSILKPSSQSSRKSLDQRSQMLKTFLQRISSLNNSCANSCAKEVNLGT